MSNLRALRVGCGFSQRDVMRRTGIHNTDLSALEHGKKYLTPGWRARLAEALSVDPTAL